MAKSAGSTPLAALRTRFSAADLIAGLGFGPPTGHAFPVRFS
jgi:hypothetical protein